MNVDQLIDEAVETWKAYVTETANSEEEAQRNRDRLDYIGHLLKSKNSALECDWSKFCVEALLAKYYAEKSDNL